MPDGIRTTYDLNAAITPDWAEAIHLMTADERSDWAAARAAAAAREYSATIEAVEIGHEIFVEWPHDDGAESEWRTLTDRQHGLVFGKPTIFIATGDRWGAEVGPMYHVGDVVRARRPA